jgi:hypothetical protein
MMNYHFNHGRNLYLDKPDKSVDSVNFNHKIDHLQNKQTFTKFVKQLSPLRQL